MKRKIIKLTGLFFMLLLLFCLTGSTLAATPADLGYKPLAPLKGIADTTERVDLGAYLGSFFKFGVGLAALFAVLMIVIGGFEYVMTDKIASKEDAKSRITGALGGLLLALVAATLLFTINPALVGLNDPQITVAPSTP